MLILSIPAAPRLRLTFLNALSMSTGVILPVNEWTLSFNLFYLTKHLTETHCNLSRAASVLSARRVSCIRGGEITFVAAADGLASRMVQSTQYLSVTDLPITCIPVSYTGRAAASEREDRGVFPRHQCVQRKDTLQLEIPRAAGFFVYSRCDRIRRSSQEHAYLYAKSTPNVTPKNGSFQKDRH